MKHRFTDAMRTRHDLFTLIQQQKRVCAFEICSAGGSPELGLFGEINLWWRAFELERVCRLTVRLLKLRRMYQQSVARFFRTYKQDAPLEQLAQQFLESLSKHSDSLVVSVSRFESALLRIKAGESVNETVVWDRDPEWVLDCLSLGKKNIPGPSYEHYWIEVSDSIEGGARLVAIQPIDS